MGDPYTRYDEIVLGNKIWLFPLFNLKKKFQQGKGIFFSFKLTSF